MMATDEEIRKEAFNLMPNGVFTEGNQVCKLCENAIRKGIQMEQERIREQVKKDSFCITDKDGVIRNDVIHISKIDIWDDMK